MIKTPKRDGSVLVTFELPAAVAAESVSICGDFNDWSETSHPLNRTDDGFKASVELAVGQRWRFRYLLDGARWENDWAADDYIGNEFGGEDSVVDLTDTATLTAPEPPAATTDKPSGTRRRKAAADTPAASAPERSRRTAPAAESEAHKPAGTAANGKPKRAAATTPAASAASATSAASAADAAARKPAAERAAGKPAADASDGAEKKPATARRKSAASRQSGKDT